MFHSNYLIVSHSYSIVKLVYITSYILWLCGLIYISGLFTYHSKTTNELSLKQLTLIEHKWYWMIITPMALISILSAIVLHLMVQVTKISNPELTTLRFSIFIYTCMYHIYCFKLIDDLSKSATPAISLLNRGLRYLLIFTLIAYIALNFKLN